MDDKLRKFIEGMPKTELHVHIEGTLEPELVFKLAEEKRKSGTLTKDQKAFLDKYKTVEEAKEARRQYADLWDFLKPYYASMAFLQTEDDFYQLTRAYLEKGRSQNVTHTRIFFDPQEHMKNGVAFADVVGGITRALKEAESDPRGKISSELIMHFLRHLPAKKSAPAELALPYKDAFETLDEARTSIDKGLIQGIGLDSGEVGNPPSKFKEAYAEAMRRHPQLKKNAHICEEGPPEYAEEAIDQLGIDCGDHGNNIRKKPELAKRVAQMGLGLTVCPYSDLRLSHVLDDKTVPKTILRDLKDHPLKEMMDLGLKVTVNSDDPAYFRTDANEGAYMDENFIVVADKLHLTRDDIIKLEENAIDVSYLSEKEKGDRRQALKNYIGGVDLSAADVSPPGVHIGFS